MRVPAVAVDLVVPVYLDTGILLDLLASIESGFAMVEQVTERTTRSSAGEVTAQASASGGFTVAEFINLFKLSLSAEARAEHERSVEAGREGERTHTYGSLLNRLRRTLRQAGAVKTLDGASDLASIGASDFVEVSGVFIENPVTESLSAIQRIAQLAVDVTEAGLPVGPGAKATSGGSSVAISKPAQRGATAVVTSDGRPGVKEFKILTRLIERALAELNYAHGRGYIVDIDGLGKARLYCSLRPQYLRDPTGTELPEGSYTVLAKVVRHYRAGESLNLLRGTTLARVRGDHLDKMLALLGTMIGGMIELPTALAKDVAGPCLHVIPIAVYR